jgi:hypothetical protein
MILSATLSKEAKDGIKNFEGFQKNGDLLNSQIKMLPHQRTLHNQLRFG